MDSLNSLRKTIADNTHKKIRTIVTRLIRGKCVDMNFVYNNISSPANPVPMRKTTISIKGLAVIL